MLFETVTVRGGAAVTLETMMTQSYACFIRFACNTSEPTCSIAQPTFYVCLINKIKHSHISVFKLQKKTLEQLIA